MYRAVYRNHINLSEIADNKANLMISINTLVVSILIAGIGSGFTFSGRDFIEHVRFTIPMSLLLVGCLISVAFAIISASPKVTNKDISKKKILNQKLSTLFFGNFVNIEKEQFVKILEKLRENQTLVYNNMSVDIYYLGLVLKKKYKMLKFSYFTFLFSMILCVVSFVGILFFSFD